MTLRDKIRGVRRSAKTTIRACQKQNEEHEHKRLEQKRRLVKNENEEQRHTQLEDMQHRAVSESEMKMKIKYYTVRKTKTAAEGQK